MIRWLLRLLPLETREAHGQEMEQVLRSSLSEVTPQPTARLRFWATTVIDILRVAPGQHREALMRDARYALRTFLRSPSFSFAAILTMAIGIGATTGVFAVVNAVLLRPLPYDDPAKVMLLWARMPDGSRTWLSPAEADDIRQSVPALVSVAGLTDMKLGLTGSGAPEELAIVGVSSTLFPMLGADMALGRAFAAADDVEKAPLTVVLSDGLWQRRFGARRDVIGSSIRLDGRSYTVIGVAPRSFGVLPPSSVFPSRVDAWVALQAHLPSRNRDVRYLHAIGRLAEGASEFDLRGQLESLGSHLSTTYPEYASRHIAFDAVRMDRDVVREVRPALLVLFATVVLVLFIAVSNVAALLLARAVSRQREIAVRAALGASPARIARQLFTEGVMLALIGGTCGLALASLAPVLARIPPLSSMPRFDHVAVDWRVATFAVVVSTLAGVLVMLAPVSEMAKRRGTLGPEVLRLTGRPQGVIRASRALLVAQIAVTASVLVISLTLARGFATLLGGDPGFRTDGVLTMRIALPPKYPTGVEVNRFYDTALERIQAISGVRSAAAISQLPLSGSMLGSRFMLARDSQAAAIDADLRGITPRYFDTMSIRTVQGRAFTAADDSRGGSIAIVDETFARRVWPGESAVGKRIYWMRQPDVPLEIVGVASAVRHRGLEVPARETVYRPHLEYPRYTMSLVVRTDGDAALLSQTVLAAIHAVDPDQPVADVMTMESRVRRSLAQPGFSTALAATLALIALALTVVGTYGLSSYSVTERHREIGIRLALGAEPGGVIRMILRDGLGYALAGLAIGLPLAFLAARACSSRLGGAGLADPFLVLMVATALLVTILAACWLPARRAARVSPSEPLRAE
jgi:putative ABC transport system permease protein